MSREGIMSNGVISCDAVICESKNIGLIATMPRSGTWYNHLFFNAYEQLLQGKTNITMTKSGITLVLANTNIGLDFLVICHAVCPGFDRYRGDYREAWEKLQFHVEGYDWAKDGISRNRHLFDPHLNGNVRIVYYYRNPLDQAVSAFMHAQKHKDPRQRSYTNSEGKQWPITSVRQYIFGVGLDSYIKQFLTFKIAKEMYPRHVLLVKYEDLVRDPETIFARVLSYFGHDARDPAHREKMSVAIEISSKDSARKMEKSMGHSLANDQTDSVESHIRDGAVGKWKRHLNEDDVQLVRERLTSFGLRLDDFDIE